MFFSRGGASAPPLRAGSHEGSNWERMSAMPDFQYTCVRHRELFFDLVSRGGGCDPARLDDVRRKMLAWLSARFPRMVLDHFNERSCLGCKLEASALDTTEVERAMAELLHG
jgi:hypothetical protein